MKSVLPNTSSSLLLGAALAGLATFTPDAEAATVYTETTDLSNGVLSPTDLTSTFTDFVADGGIVGQMFIGPDFCDAILINGPASSSVSIPFSITASSSNVWFTLNAYNGGSLGTKLVNMPNAGQTYSDTLTFIMPASGKVTLYTTQNHEFGGHTYNYTIGAVPEASTGMLSLAAMAAAALRRRREQV